MSEGCPRLVRRTTAWSVALSALLLAVMPAPVAIASTQDPTPARALDLLEPYVGLWLAEERLETAAGRGYRFEYRLEWFDAARSILEMTISRRFDDGEAALVWSGFKGWDPVKGETYYHGFSVEGRVARGVVVAGGDGYPVDTVYDGLAASGSVRIRDRFAPIADGAFVAVTEMMRDGAWVEISRDLWRRAPAVGDGASAGPVDLTPFDGSETWPLIEPAGSRFDQRLGLQRSFFEFALWPPGRDPYTTDLVLDVFPTHYAGRDAYLVQWTTSGDPQGGAGALDAIWVDAGTFQVRHRVAQTGPPSADGGAGVYSVMRHDVGRALRVQVPAEGDVVVHERPVASPSFDFATMGYLFALMDLEEGATFRVLNVGQPPDLEPLALPVRVGGLVTIPAADGMARTAREVTLTAANRSTRITFWVSDRAPYFLGWRYVLTASGRVLNEMRYRGMQLSEGPGAS